MHHRAMRAWTSAQKPDCPVAPASRESTHVRALHRACLIIGGVEQLATHFGVGEFELRAWMSGVGEPPEALFLAAVEIILLNLETPGPAT